MIISLPRRSQHVRNMGMSDPHIFQKSPIVQPAEPGTYLWCACGRSAAQPFCDGSHAGTAFKPVLFEAKADEDVIFCGCKHTATRPFCDGAHNNLPGATFPDDPQSAANRAVKAVPHGADSSVPLDGTCYVFVTSRATLL